MSSEAQIPGLSTDLTIQLRGELARYPDVKKAILYGSRAKGNYRPNSDIDLCLEAPDMDFSHFLQLSHALDELVLPYSLDLVLKHQIDNPQLLHHIQRVGIVVYVIEQMNIDFVK